MLKEEWKSLFHNKLLLLVIFAILLIPAIYSGLFLASMWDPYGEVENLPVAVVNEDQSVVYNDKKLDIGKELADSLADNDSMAFNVVDAKTASMGLQNGTYYMVITIPKDFSKNASSLMDKKPQKMVLNYQTNPGKNYIAMKMSESAMKEVKQNITAEVTRTYAENVFDNLQTIGDGFDDAVDGTKDMLTGEKKLMDGNDTITKNLKKLSDSSLTFKEGSDTLTEGIQTYTNGVSQLDKGMHTLNGGVSQISKEAVGGAKTLASGAKTMDKSLVTYTNGVATARNGSRQLAANNTALNDAVNSVSTGVGSLKTGSTQLLGGLKQMQTSLDAALTEEKVSQIKTAAGSLKKMNSSIQELNTAVNGNGSDKTGFELSGMTNAMTSVGGNIEKAGGSIQTAGNSDLTKAGEKVTAAYTTLATMLQTDDTLTDDQKQNIQKAMASLYDKSSEDTAQSYMQQAGKELESAGSELNTAGTTLTQLAKADMGSQVSTLKTSIKQLSAASNQLLEPSSTALTTLLGGMQSMQTALEQTKEKNGSSGLIEGMTTLDSGLTTLQNGIDSKDGLKAGMKTYTQGVASLDSGLKTLDGYKKKINTGSAALAKGSSTLEKGLDTGITKLSGGVNQLLEGSQKLVTNNNTLVNGSKKLSDGAEQISEGASKLKDGSVKVGDGLWELTDGTHTLNNALSDGAEEIRNNDASNATLDMFAEPVETSSSQITTVKNNGHAMAAYMMSVGLWVGCLAFCLMYPLASYKGEFKGGFSWWLSKASIIYPLAVAMGFVLVGVLHVANGFEPMETGKTLLVASVAAVAFMSMMYFFNILLGKVGSFLMLVFMVLQLAGSAGTYPVELSGSMVAALHKYVPFTYTVDAFRSTISGGADIGMQLKVLFTIAVVFSCLTIAVFCIRGEKLAKHKATIYEWIEEKGLA